MSNSTFFRLFIFSLLLVTALALPVEKPTDKFQRLIAENREEQEGKWGPRLQEYDSQYGEKMGQMIRDFVSIQGPQPQPPVPLAPPFPALRLQAPVPPASQPASSSSDTLYSSDDYKIPWSSLDRWSVISLQKKGEQNTKQYVVYINFRLEESIECFETTTSVNPYTVQNQEILTGWMTRNMWTFKRSEVLIWTSDGKLPDKMRRGAREFVKSMDVAHPKPKQY